MTAIGTSRTSALLPTAGRPLGITMKHTMNIILVLLLEIPSVGVTTAFALTQAPTGDPEKGRQVFHGQGICYFCHGQNGDPEDLPELKPETLRTVRGLRPQPPDLRR